VRDPLTVPGISTRVPQSLVCFQTVFYFRARGARIVRMQTRTDALLTVLALSQMEYVDYTVERPLRDVLITRLGMWFDVNNADGAVNEHDVQLFLNEFAEVHFMAAAAATGRAESLINNGFTSKHALASLTALQLEKFGFLVGHAQVLASYLGAQQHSMPLINSPASTGATDTGQTSPPPPKDCPEKTPIETAPSNKRPAAQAFPPAFQAGPDAQSFQPAFQAAPTFQPAPSPVKVIPREANGSQSSSISQIRKHVAKTAKKVRTYAMRAHCLQLA
jgi:hypothetical protein